MLQCSAEDLIEVILPRLTPSLSTWQYLSARVKALSSSSSPLATDSPVAVAADIAKSDIDVAAMLHEYSALHWRVRSFCERVLEKHTQLADDCCKQSLEKCPPTSGSKMLNDTNIHSQNDAIDPETSSILNTDPGSENAGDTVTDRGDLHSPEKLRSSGSSTDGNNTGDVSSMQPITDPSDSGVPPSTADNDSVHVNESQELNSGELMTDGNSDAGNFGISNANKTQDRGNLSDLPDSGIPPSTADSDSKHVNESEELNSGKLPSDGNTDAGNLCVLSGNESRIRGNSGDLSDSGIPPSTADSDSPHAEESPELNSGKLLTGGNTDAGNLSQDRGNLSDPPDSGIPPSTTDSDCLHVDKSTELNSGKLLTGRNTETGNSCVSSGNKTQDRGNLSDPADSGIPPTMTDSDSVRVDESQEMNSGKLLTDGNTDAGNFRVSSGNENPESGNFCESSDGLCASSKMDSGGLEMGDVLMCATEKSNAAKLPESDNFTENCGTVDVNSADGEATTEVEKPVEESCSQDNLVPLTADDGHLETDVPRPCSDDDSECKHSAVTVIDNMLEVSKTRDAGTVG